MGRRIVGAPFWKKPANASPQVVGGFTVLVSFLTVESFVTVIVVFDITVVVSLGGFTVLVLCSPLSRTQPANPRRPPNCLDDSTAPVFASTTTFACVFLPFGMMSIAYSVTPLSTFISPEPIWPGTAHSATIFAESGEIMFASAL